ncbi:MAG: YceI family protein [Ginsengibacter sp.]
MNKGKTCFFIVFLFLAMRASSQLYYTKNGDISFFSKSVLQNIEADNNQVISVLNTQTGSMQFSLLNNAFEFEKAKMQEDFNDNYIESDKYPRSFFKGNITNLQAVNFGQDGTYNVNVSGDLTIHGVTKQIETPATINIKNGNISGKAVFHIHVKDYNIDIPTIVSKKIAENIEIRVNCTYQPK